MRGKREIEYTAPDCSSISVASAVTRTLATVFCSTRMRALGPTSSAARPSGPTRSRSPSHTCASIPAGALDHDRALHRDNLPAVIGSRAAQAEKAADRKHRARYELVRRMHDAPPP